MDTTLIPNAAKIELPKNVTIRRKSSGVDKVFENATPSLAPPFYVVMQTVGEIQPLRNATMIPIDDIDSINIQEYVK